MKLVRLQAVCFLLSLCGMALAQSLHLSISTTSSTVASGEPVSISVELINGTDHELTVRQHVGEVLPGSVYTVAVTKADGSTAKETTLARSIRGGVNGSRSLRVLPPGASLIENLNITRFIDMTSPGVYQVVVTRERSETDQTALRSNMLSIRVAN